MGRCAARARLPHLPADAPLDGQSDGAVEILDRLLEENRRRAAAQGEAPLSGDDDTEADEVESE